MSLINRQEANASSSNMAAVSRDDGSSAATPGDDQASPRPISSACVRNQIGVVISQVGRNSSLSHIQDTNCIFDVGLCVGPGY